VPHHQTPNTAIPTKTHPESPKTHQAVTSQVYDGDTPIAQAVADVPQEYADLS